MASYKEANVMVWRLFSQVKKMSDVRFRRHRLFLGHLNGDKQNALRGKDAEIKFLDKQNK